jgi:exonuclease VII small subunit
MDPIALAAEFEARLSPLEQSVAELKRENESLVAALRRCEERLRTWQDDGE